jgi:hypothetical protein
MALEKGRSRGAKFKKLPIRQERSGGESLLKQPVCDKKATAAMLQANDPEDAVTVKQIVIDDFARWYKQTVVVETAGSGLITRLGDRRLITALVLSKAVGNHRLNVKRHNKWACSLNAAVQLLTKRPTAVEAWQYRISGVRREGKRLMAEAILPPDFPRHLESVTSVKRTYKIGSGQVVKTDEIKINLKVQDYEEFKIPENRPVRLI